MDERVVGLVGLGGMGAPMAEHLVSAGYEVHGYNRTASRASALFDLGVRRAESPRAVAEAASLVIVSMFDDAALEATVLGEDGVAAGCRAGSIVVETSTVHPDTSARTAAAVAERGGMLLRAPVSGNTVVARAAGLTFLCSGDREAYDACAPVFDVLGRSRHYLGSGEEARYAKLALNLMIAGTMQIMSEALGLAEGAGLDRRAMLELMKASAVGSPFVGYKTDPLVARDYSPTFTVTGMRKDLRLLLGVAGGLGVPLPTTGLVDQLLAACESAGWAELDFAALVLLEQRLRGAEEEPGRPEAASGDGAASAGRATVG